MHWFRHTDAGFRGLLLGTVAVMAVSVGLRVPTGVASASAADDPTAAKDSAVSEEDPFADELNPFGKGKAGKSARPDDAAPKSSAGKKDAPADSSTETEPVSEPKPSQRARTRPKLPVPFPEAPADEDAGLPLRDRLKGWSDTLRKPDRSDRADDAAWLDRGEAEKMLADAEALERDGKLEEARDRLRQAVDKDPSLVVGHLALGVVLRRLGDFRGSVEACTKGIEIDPQEPELYLRRGIAWYHQGLYGIAIEDFEDAAGIAYEDPRPELWRGLTLIELDRPLEAINAYASAIRRDRACMLAYLNRGLTYLATNEPRKAEFDFNQAIRQNPKDARAWFNRGVAQARQGRFSEAIVSYETVLGIDPDHEAAHRNLEAARRMATRPTSRSGR